eukprot:EG_transcript_52670
MEPAHPGRAVPVDSWKPPAACSPMTLNDVRAKLRQYLDDNATEWNFRGNRIGAKGTVALAVALRTNSTVEKVDLSNNDIGPEGAKALAEALRTNATLREVNLYRN